MLPKTLAVTKIFLIFAADLNCRLMGRKKTIEKEPVTIRFKELANGNQSIYLDIYQDGKRKYESSNYILCPKREETELMREERMQRLWQ